MPDRCGHVWRDRLTFELFQAEDGFEEFASSILAAKWKNSHLYFTFSYSCCEKQNEITDKFVFDLVFPFVLCKYY